MNHERLREIRTVLTPTDFSDTSEEAVAFAARLAARLGARLVVVHVVESPPPDAMPRPDLAEAQERAGQELDRRAYKLQLRDIQVETRVVVGTPVDEIVAAAERERADVLVLGTHGRRGVSRAIVGSVAEHVLRVAPCPVVTVREGTTAARTVRDVVL